MSPEERFYQESEEEKEQDLVPQIDSHSVLSVYIWFLSLSPDPVLSQVQTDPGMCFCLVVFSRCRSGCFTAELLTSSGLHSAGRKSNRPSPPTEARWTLRKTRDEDTHMFVL